MDTDRSGFIIYAMYAMVSLDTRGSFSTSIGTVSVVPCVPQYRSG